MEMFPAAGSIMRNRPRVREDLPAPVLPTMPTWNELHELHRLSLGPTEILPYPLSAQNVGRDVLQHEIQPLSVANTVVVQLYPALVRPGVGGSSIFVFPSGLDKNKVNTFRFVSWPIVSNKNNLRM